MDKKTASEILNNFYKSKYWVDELIRSGKYICGTTKLPCCFCSLYCGHRKKRETNGDSD